MFKLSIEYSKKLLHDFIKREVESGDLKELVMAIVRRHKVKPLRQATPHFHIKVTTARPLGTRKKSVVLVGI
jgi:hypothetical protein